MHSVTVLNVLRQRALPNVDFRNPSEVLANLNDMFQGESHNNLMLTMWYGVYRTDDRMLTYGSAGHHPAYLVAGRSAGVASRRISGADDRGFSQHDVSDRANAGARGKSLYLFSDGLFEIVTKDQQQWELSDLLPLFLQPGSGGTPDVAKVSEAERVYNAVREVAAPGPLADDVSLLVVTFT